MKFLLLSLFVAAAYCEKVPFNESFPDVPQEVINLIPPEIRTMMEGLTDADKDAIKEAAKIVDEEEAIAFLRKKSPILGEKVDRIYKDFTKKVDNLKNKAAKEFAQYIIAEAKAAQTKYIKTGEINEDEMKKAARDAVIKFQRLPVAAKAELNKTFPKFIAFFENEKFMKRINVMKSASSEEKSKSSEESKEQQ